MASKYGYTICPRPLCLCNIYLISQKATEEIKSGNRDIANKVRHIGNKFLNAVEISAQEAAYLVLQIPMRRSSREFQFINT